MEARVRRDEVQAAEGVEGAADDEARDAVQRREVPGYLRFVDGEVRGDGAVEALLREDGVLFGLFRDRGCGREAVVEGEG